jgi:hypothetical protein
MAVNMMGVKKQLIAFGFGLDIAPMVNTVIKKLLIIMKYRKHIYIYKMELIYLYMC